MSSFRIAIAQMNPTVGDYRGNAQKIMDWIKAAEHKKADLIVFPELALPGYPMWDLANKKSFVSAGLEWLDKIGRATRPMHIHAVVGYVAPGKKEDGRSRNSLAWIHGGKVIARYAKQLLPTYDVFLEDIFFEPGTESVTVPWKGRKAGLTICEDIWDERYDRKPMQALKNQKADLVLNISASPFYRGVAEARDALLKKHAEDYGMPMIYVNQVGGQDDLIFDGRSLVADAKGRVLFRAPAFIENLFYFDWNPKEMKPYDVPVAENTNSPAEMYEALLLGVRDYCRKNGFWKVVIGLSGGIDSALVAALSVDALGRKAVVGVTMPGTYSSEGSWKDSEELSQRLGIEFRVNPIRKKYEFLLKAYREQKEKSGAGSAAAGKITLAMENLQARIRGLELMYISNDENRLVLTTGNKSELAMGYCTLYGDMAGGLAVIGDVYKSDVYRLAWFRNQKEEVIPKSILIKAPSAELRPNQKDEDSLPPYEILDEILYRYVEENKSSDEIIHLMKGRAARALIVQVIRKVDHNEYKRRQTPPILRVTRKAWFGRRMPITNRFEG